MEAFTSVSQGFAVRKPKRKPSKSVLDQHALQHFADPLETAPLRHRLYRENWESFKTKIESLEQGWHKELAGNVCKFLTSSVAIASDTVHGAIPTAILVPGLTEFENSQIFGLLLDSIRTHDSFPYLARVSSASCPNVKTAFQHIAKQLISIDSNESQLINESENDFSDGAEDEPMVQDSGSTKHHISMYDLRIWYDKKRFSKMTDPVVLIVLEDIDLFPEGVVRDLLQLWSSCAFPSMLVLGVVNGFMQTGHLVPSELEAPYKYQKFYSTVSPPVRLEKFLNAIILDWKFPFRVSGDIIRFMAEYFLNQQFSIQRLLQAYRLCLMEHFRSPVSTFCSPDLAGICAEVIRDFNEVFEQTLLSIPSWCKFNAERAATIQAGAQSPSAKIRMKVATAPEKYPLEKIQPKVNSAYESFLEWQVLLLIVYEMGTGLPESPIGISLSQLYTVAWSGDLHRKAPDEECSPLGKLIGLVNNFSRQEMDRRLSNSLNRINAFLEESGRSKVVNVTNCNVPKALSSFLSRLRTEPNEETPTPDEVLPTTSSAPPKNTISIAASTNWSAIRENLRMNIKAKNDDPEYTTLREDVKRFLEVNTKTKLKASPGSSIPFAEVFVFNDVEHVRNQISPNVHKRLHTALCCPSMYLKCECCEGLGPGSMSDSLPDTSILYRLFLEQTSKRMNLNDMFMSFKAIIDPPPARATASSSRKVAEKQEQNLLRFKQAVSELEFMGFMKSSKTKPDEAHKLTWAYSAHSNEA